MGGRAGANEEQMKQLKGKEPRRYAQRRSQWLLQRGHGNALPNLTGRKDGRASRGTGTPPFDTATTRGRLKKAGINPSRLRSEGEAKQEGGKSARVRSPETVHDPKGNTNSQSERRAGCPPPYFCT